VNHHLAVGVFLAESAPPIRELSNERWRRSGGRGQVPEREEAGVSAPLYLESIDARVAADLEVVDTSSFRVDKLDPL